MIISDSAQNLGFLVILFLTAGGVCAGLGVGTKLRPYSQRFLIGLYAFSVVAGLLFLAQITSQPWLRLASLLGTGIGIYQLFRGKEGQASQRFGWLVFVSSLALIVLIVLPLEYFLI